MATGLHTERGDAWSAHPRSGWAFWWRWVLATNLGWFPGIYLGMRLADVIVPERPLAGAVVASAVAAVFFGGAQALALRATLERPAAWWLVTALAWPVGILLARLALTGTELSPLLDAVVVAFIAGGCLGVPQARLLAGAIPQHRAWPWVSAVGWGVLFPGALPGLFLVLAARPSSSTGPVSGDDA